MKKSIYFLGLSCFVSLKLLAQTPTLDWVSKIGSVTGTESGKSIVTDNNGNVYTVGHFESDVDADPGAANYPLTSNGMADILITKSDSDGNLLWASSIGGVANDAAYGVAINSSNEIYITGYYQGTVDFNPSSSVTNFMYSSNGSIDIFLLKLDSNGNYIWANSVGGWGTDIGYAVDTDASGNALIAGSFSSTNVDFNPSASATNYLNAVGGTDGFYAYYSSNGDYTYAKGFGGTADDVVTAIDYNVFNFSGYVNLTGYFSGTADFDPTGTLNRTSNGGADIFVSSFLIDGTFLTAQSVGGQFDDKAYGITTDSQGNIIYTGFFQSTVDFDPSVSSTSFNTYGLADVFVSKLDVDLNFVWVKRIGNSGNDKAYAIDIDAQDNIYITGNYTGMLDSDPEAGTAYFTTVSGAYDIFILKLNNLGSFIWSTSFHYYQGAGSTNVPSSIHVDTDLNMYIAGSFQGTVDFDLNAPGTGYSLFSSGLSDYFLAKIASQSSIDFTCSGDLDYYMSIDSPVFPDLTQLMNATTNCALNSTVSISQNPAIGSQLNEGTTLVTLTATNDCGDVETCQFNVNYINDLSLTIQCPSDLQINDAICPDFTSMANVTSACSTAVVTITQTPAAGTSLALGTTTVTLEASNECGLIQSCSFVVDRTLGINESNMTSLAVYPNPTKGFITIESNRPTTLQLVSVQGQFLRSIEIEAKTTIDLSNLSPGVYLLIGEGNNPIRFVKE